MRLAVAFHQLDFEISAITVKCQRTGKYLTDVLSVENKNSALSWVDNNFLKSIMITNPQKYKQCYVSGGIRELMNITLLFARLNKLMLRRITRLSANTRQ